MLWSWHKFLVFINIISTKFQHSRHLCSYEWEYEYTDHKLLFDEYKHEKIVTRIFVHCDWLKMEVELAVSWCLSYASSSESFRVSYTCCFIVIYFAGCMKICEAGCRNVLRDIVGNLVNWRFVFNVLILRLTTQLFRYYSNRKIYTLCSCFIWRMSIAQTVHRFKWNNNNKKHSVIVLWS